MGMSVRAQKPVESSSTPERAAYGDSREVLQEVGAPDVTVAVWSRTIPPDVQAGLAAWAAAEPEPLVWHWPLQGPRWSDVLSALTPDAAAWLQADVERWVRDMARWSQRHHLAVRLGWVTDATCPRFHVDWLPLRLLCTYVGPGTEWIAPEDANCAALQAPAGADGLQVGLLRTGAAVRRAGAGEVLVGKGRGHPHRVCGFVHRSPAIPHRNLARVVLVISAMPDGPLVPESNGQSAHGTRAV